MEREEAIRNGEYALRLLEEARDALRSARSWGIVDIFGGKSLSGLLKHTKLEKARGKMKEAERYLRLFNSYAPDHLDVDIGTGLTILDFLFDGLIADLMVQEKIKKALSDTENAIARLRFSLSSI